MKQFITILAIIGLLLMLPMTANAVTASGKCGDDAYWSLEGDTLTISGTGAMYSDTVYPNRKNPWSDYLTTIKKVVVEEGITSIERFNCNLQSVQLPNSLERIGGAAFFCYNSTVGLNGNGISEIIIPPNVTCIERMAFDGCYNLTSIEIPSGVTVIRDYLFCACTSLNNIVLPNNITAIEGMAFANTAITTIDLPSNLQYIHNHAFQGCRSLQTIVIPASVVDIGMSESGEEDESGYTFCDCSSLTDVYFTGNAPNIHDYCFWRAHAVTAHYPIDNATYTDAVKQNYHGTVTWVPTCSHRSIVTDARVEPTCITTGLTEGQHCADCNEIIVSQEVIPVISHALTKTNKVEPTCLDKGTDAYWTCSVCKKLFKDENGVNEIAKPIEIDALGHHEVIDAAVAPTCLVAGLTAGKHCDRCNTVLVAQLEAPALGHQEVNDLAVAPTCTETGLTAGKHCGRCNAVLTAQEIVPALGHKEVTDNAVEATCTETGLTEGKHCSICNEVLVAQETVPKKNHHYVMDPAVEPTCTETGLTSGFHCDVCNEVFVAQTIVPVKDHSLSSHDEVPATCSSIGTEAYWTCSVCKKFFSDDEGKNEIEKPVEIPMTGHNWGEANYVWSPDNSSVTAKHICLNDESHKEEKTVGVTSAIVSPTERTRGSASYTSEFFNVEGFTVQKKNISIPMLKNMSIMYLPNQLTTIEDEAFAGIDCEAVIISTGCTSIGKHAFENCGNLLYVKVPASTTIDPDAFEGCEDIVIDMVAE